MRWILILLLVLAPAVALAKLDLPVELPSGIPTDQIKIKIPGLDKILKAEPALTTGISDAVLGVPFLDDYDPQALAPLTELPYSPERGFPLVRSGAFEHYAQSYCLHAGMYGPGGGDGYLLAPLKGDAADVIRSILRNSFRHPEIEQSTIQGLVWAILARSKIEDLGAEYQEAAGKLLTAKEIRKLSGGNGGWYDGRGA